VETPHSVKKMTMFTVNPSLALHSSSSFTTLTTLPTTFTLPSHPYNMDYAYGLLDKGYIPDAALRPVIRQLCRKRLREIDNGRSGGVLAWPSCLACLVAVLPGYFIA
jgi:hypothetical protein